MTKRAIRAMTFMLLAVIVFVCALPFVMMATRSEPRSVQYKEPRTVQDLINNVSQKELVNKTIGRPDSKS